MNPEQALQMLYDVTTKVGMPKVDHDKCLEAAQTILKAIQKMQETISENNMKINACTCKNPTKKSGGAG